MGRPDLKVVKSERLVMARNSCTSLAVSCSQPENLPPRPQTRSSSRPHQPGPESPVRVGVHRWRGAGRGAPPAKVAKVLACRLWLTLRISFSSSRKGGERTRRRGAVVNSPRALAPDPSGSPPAVRLHRSRPPFAMLQSAPRGRKKLGRALRARAGGAYGQRGSGLAP